MSTATATAAGDGWTSGALARASILGLGAFLALLNGQVLTPILPLMASDLGVSEAAVGQLVTVAGAAGVLLGLIAGPLSDRTGRRPMLVASAVVLAAASLATAAGGSYAALLWIRFVSGVGATLMLPAILAATADLFSAEARPRAMGVIMACSGGSMVVGWPAAAVVSVRWGWRAVFVMLGVSFIAELALVMGFLPGSRPGAGPAATLRQSYSRVLGDRRVVSVALAGCLSAASWFGFMTYLGWYLATQCGLATGHQAPVLSAMGVGYSVASLAAGGGIRRVGAARVAIGASASAAACALAMTARSGLWTAVAGAVVIATLRGAGVTAISDLLIGLRPEDRGTVAGLNALGFSVGVLMGAGLGGLALANGGYRLLFFTLSALAAGASVLLARRGRGAEAHRFAPTEP